MKAGGGESSSRTSGNKKRRFKDWKDGRGGSRPPTLLNNPKRGAPGILLTCDRGREIKCRREALQIIDHYYAKYHESRLPPASDGNEGTTTITLSLEEELKQLQEQDSRKESNFGIFETGCSGVVFALCTVPGSEMIPPVKLEKQKLYNTNSVDRDDDPKSETDQPSAKKLKLEDASPAEATTINGLDELSGKPSPLSLQLASAATVCSTEWDPVPIVRTVLQDIENDTGNDAPSSRFVSRMIPLQATCYVSEEELTIASRSLIQRYFPATATTFAVAVKRRFCPAALPKPKIIDIVAAAVLEKVPKCKVDLDHPEVTVVMEICKTMCGLSVIPNCPDDFKNFNLAEARGKRSHGDDEEEDKE